MMNTSLRQPAIQGETLSSLSPAAKQPLVIIQRSWKLARIGISRQTERSEKTSRRIPRTEVNAMERKQEPGKRFERKKQRKVEKSLLTLQVNPDGTRCARSLLRPSVYYRGVGCQDNECRVSWRAKPSRPEPSRAMPMPPAAPLSVVQHYTKVPVRKRNRKVQQSRPFHIADNPPSAEQPCFALSCMPCKNAQTPGREAKLPRMP
ncbi:hypothetical protein VTK56DRAFT_1845 [Thermocarpiscus australiensis]